jgi:hypothetical protein
MPGSGDVEVFRMPAVYDPLEQCVPGAEVIKERVDHGWPEERLAVVRAGDYKIITREQHPNRSAWLRFTIQKISGTTISTTAPADRQRPSG